MIAVRIERDGLAVERGDVPRILGQGLVIERQGIFRAVHREIDVGELGRDVRIVVVPIMGRLQRFHRLGIGAERGERRAETHERTGVPRVERMGAAIERDRGVVFALLRHLVGEELQRAALVGLDRGRVGRRLRGMSFA